jgi:hypothetical protein
MAPWRQSAPLARDAALRRLRRLTIAATAIGTALAGAFAGLAANAVPGRSGTGGASPPSAGGGGELRLPAQARTRHAPAPATTQSRSDDAPAPTTTQAPAPPAAPPAPAPTPAPPVVVSGGS